ncbi:hypothetical protein IW261DRAFT_350292 [Armillaria novae-zelandiae]|uniref:TRIP4/RQT4 C2HC5-type zinc finger domain-containing protein n=1 Tax=Armillaria novae-zelandiae TaxID=153914 RepID=A0AA39UI33_9AGAR|nr:hypothetical protein IW261DRAFT_350292 [Armillaria novae-zelandiae]
MSTPWSSSSSLPSDRIKPKPKPKYPPHSQSQKKQKQQKQPSTPPTPKSKHLASLESLLHAVQNTTRAIPDPKGGCFCQAQTHPLSPYTPACATCGLLLCALNPPQHACPHCHHAPPPTTRDSAIARLQREIDALARREEEARERARVAMGGFPALGGGGGGATSTPTPSQYKVLSLSVNSKTKKVVVSASSRGGTPAASRPGTPEPVRVPRPPAEVVYAKRGVEAARPFAKYVGEAARYVPVPPDKVTAKGKVKGKGRGDEAGPS